MEPSNKIFIFDSSNQSIMTSLTYTAQNLSSEQKEASIIKERLAALDDRASKSRLNDEQLINYNSLVIRLGKLIKRT